MLYIKQTRVMLVSEVVMADDALAKPLSAKLGCSTFPEDIDF